MHVIIAEPAASNIGPAPAVPAATFIDIAGDPVLASPPRKRLALVTEDWFPGLWMSRRKRDAVRQEGIPLPRRKPAHLIRLASAVAGLNAFSSARQIVSPALPSVKNYGNWAKQAVRDEQDKCERLLQGLDVEFEARNPIGDGRGCGVAYPLSVKSIAGVAISPAATLNCEMVAALHAWITQVAKPTARQQFNTRLVGVQNASSYACRRRNSSSTGKLSEHALGNAIDIADFRFSNRMEASVAGQWSGAAKGLSVTSRNSFFKRTRAGACKHFNTVLGPGSDPFHKDHYHLDLMKLRPGRGKYCR
jgi:hypothetical protein